MADSLVSLIVDSYVFPDIFVELTVSFYPQNVRLRFLPLQSGSACVL